MSNKHFWSYPFGFLQNTAIVITLFYIGLIIEVYIQGKGIVIPSFPDNIILFAIFLTTISILNFLPRIKVVKSWLRGVSLSIIVLLAMVFLTLLAGIFPQTRANNKIITYLGFDHVITSWPFLLITLLLLANLFSICLKRWQVKSWSDFAFFLNHWGIFIIFSAAMFSAGDTVKLNITLPEKKPIWFGTTKQQKIDLPFALELQKFTLQQYPSKFILLDNNLEEVSINKHFISNKKKDYELNNLKIKLIKYFQHAFPFNEDFKPIDHFGSAPAALIEIDGKRQWLFAGSNIIPKKIVKLNDYHLSLTSPSPQKYTSFIKYYTPEGKISSFELEVNKPFDLKGWKLYQVGHEQNVGKYSKISNIEAVYDPWLWAVYIGMFMVTTGIVILPFTLKRKKYV